MATPSMALAPGTSLNFLEKELDCITLEPHYQQFPHTRHEVLFSVSRREMPGVWIQQLLVI